MSSEENAQLSSESNLIHIMSCHAVELLILQISNYSLSMLCLRRLTLRTTGAVLIIVCRVIAKSRLLPPLVVRLNLWLYTIKHIIF